MQVTGVEDIFIKPPSFSNYLPRLLKKKLMDRTQLLRYLESLGIKNGTKVCIGPKKRRRNGRVRSSFSELNNNGPFQNASDFSVHIYDDAKNKKGALLGITVPAWIVANTMELVKEMNADKSTMMNGYNNNQNGYNMRGGNVPSSPSSPQEPPDVSRNRSNSLLVNLEGEEEKDEDDGQPPPVPSPINHRLSQLQEVQNDIEKHIKNLKSIKRMSQSLDDSSISPPVPSTSPPELTPKSERKIAVTKL